MRKREEMDLALNDLKDDPGQKPLFIKFDGFKRACLFVDKFW